MFFAKRGYAYFSLSNVIREELKNRGQKITRNSLIRMGNRMREQSTPDILARRVLEKVKDKAVIDSIRNPREVVYLKKQKGFVLISVDAPVELRYERAKKRGREESASTLQEFKAKEAEEMSQQERGQQLQTCMNMADFTVWNDGSLHDLHKKLEELL